MPNAPAADALVIFGVSGDLAAKMILPALARLAERGVAPRIVGVAHAARAPAAVLRQARQRIEGEDAALAAGVDALASRFAYVSGDLEDPATYARLAEALAGARFALYYLAIPPQFFAAAIRGLAHAGLARRGAVAIEKPFGHDLESARALEHVVESAFPPDAVFRIDHYLAKDPVRNLADMRARTAWLDALWSCAHVPGVQITMAEDFGVGTRGAFYEEVGALLDVFQSHLLQLCAITAMEAVPPADGDAFAAARIEALRAIAPLAPADIVYGQYVGYRREAQVAAASRVPTYVAARVSIDVPRFAGVPFYIRAGKRLALTATQVALALTPVRLLHHDCPDGVCEGVRFRLGPGAVTIDLDTQRLRDGAARDRIPLSLNAALPPDEDRDAYVNLLGAALAGDHSMSERAAGVTAAWRVVADVLHADLPVHPYAAGSWGPAEAQALLRPHERWVDPSPA